MTTTTGVKITAFVGSSQYNLTDGTNFWFQGHEGLGIAPLHRLEETGPQQDGVSDVGFRLDRRTFHVTFGIHASSDADYYTNRDILSRIFKPSKQPIKLRFYLSNGQVREISCNYSNGLRFDSTKKIGFSQSETIEFTAADPTFYDPNQQLSTFNIGGSNQGFVVPATIPAYIGRSTINQTYPVSYSGSYASYPVVRIIGPITSPVITNVSTGDKLDFTGTTIGAGDYYEINTGYGIKTITDSAGVNRFGKLVTPGSGLATFRIEADPDVPGGNNIFQITATGINSVTAVYLIYYNRYVGI